MHLLLLLYLLLAVAKHPLVEIVASLVADFVGLQAWIGRLIPPCLHGWIEPTIVWLTLTLVCFFCRRGVSDFSDRFELVRKGLNNMMAQVGSEVAKSGELLLMAEMAKPESQEGKHRIFVLVGGCSGNPEHQTLMRCSPWSSDLNTEVDVSLHIALPLPMVVKTRTRQSLFCNNKALDCYSSDTLAKHIASQNLETKLFAMTSCRSRCDLECCPRLRCFTMVVETWHEGG